MERKRTSFGVPSWENQFLTGETLEQLPRENKTTIAPSLPGFDTDNRPGKQKGSEGKNRRVDSQSLGPVALPRGNPQPGPRSRSDRRGFAAFNERSKRRRCLKGKPCANTCISLNKKCRVELSRGLKGLVQAISREGAFDPKRYSNWPVQAEGFYGIVSFSPDGNRVVKLLKDRGDGKGGFGPHEVEIAKKMGDLGHSPKIHSYSDQHIEMDRAAGEPLWKGYQRAEGDEPMSASQALAAASSIRALHRLGYYHGDMHNRQFIVNGNNVKLIDFGLSSPASKDPRKVIQDLNKASSLVFWANPELDSDPYVKLVRKYREMYRNSPSKKKSEKEEWEREVGRKYLQELSSM